MSKARQSQIINSHLEAAKAYANLSYARRLKVGSVILKDDRIVSIGYNGTPSGSDNNCEWLVHPGNLKIKRSLKKIAKQEVEEELSRGWVLESKPEVCHAEMNAIMFAAKNGVSTNHCTLVVTHSPCFECAKMIVQCGIDKVYYDVPYRDLSPVEFLKKCNVYVEEIK